MKLVQLSRLYDFVSVRLFMHQCRPNDLSEYRNWLTQKLSTAHPDVYVGGKIMAWYFCGNGVYVAGVYVNGVYVNSVYVGACLLVVRVGPGMFVVMACLLVACMLWRVC